MIDAVKNETVNALEPLVKYVLILSREEGESIPVYVTALLKKCLFFLNVWKNSYQVTIW